MKKSFITLGPGPGHLVPLSDSFAIFGDIAYHMAIGNTLTAFLRFTIFYDFFSV